MDREEPVGDRYEISARPPVLSLCQSSDYKSHPDSEKINDRRISAVSGWAGFAIC
jgi:hypothetical protein